MSREMLYKEVWKGQRGEWRHVCGVSVWRFGQLNMLLLDDMLILAFSKDGANRLHKKIVIPNRTTTGQSHVSYWHPGEMSDWHLTGDLVYMRDITKNPKIENVLEIHNTHGLIERLFFMNEEDKDKWRTLLEKVSHIEMKLGVVDDSP